MKKMQFNTFSLLAVMMFCFQASAENEKLDIGKDNFQKFCSSCHGMHGAGDGPIGKTLPPGTIPNIKNGKFKYATSDEKMADLIKRGGSVVGLSPLMPPHPTLENETIDGLIEYIHYLGKQK